MNQKKTLILSIIILLSILAIIIIALLLLNANTNSNSLGKNPSEEVGGSILDDYIRTEDNSISRSSYFDINTCVGQYLQKLNTKSSIYYGRDENGNYVITTPQDEIKQNIYDVLSENYISKNNITLENIYDYAKPIDKETLFAPLNVKVLQNDTIKSFIVQGLVESLQMEVIQEIFLVVNIDVAQNRFSIEPLNGEYTSIDEIKVEKLEEKIEANDNNKFEISSSGYEDIVKDYINLYKRITLGNPEKMYNLLDQEYREKRFGNLEEFKKYVETNKQQIGRIRVEQYQTTAQDNSTQYICIDQHGNYYIFIENAIMDYSVMLDTYTADLPSFTEKYNSSNDQVKVGMNIQKVISALNNKDYRYIYNKLDLSFRNNNFPTEQDLGNYLKANLFETNNIEHLDFVQEGNVYIYKTKITDKNQTNSQEKVVNFIMQLDKETEFTMSFNIE